VSRAFRPHANPGCKRYENDIKLLSQVTFDFLKIKCFELVDNFSKCLLKPIDQLKIHLNNELNKRN